ncbi:MAG: hypothetical protein RIE58_01230 [Vicingaceae bacterium]
MKRKNYKSAIHNFADSFQSIDYMKSGALAFNVLVQLKEKGLEPKATFDFLNDSIFPEGANTREARSLISDYRSWLPDHLSNHNCDPEILEKLMIEVSANLAEAVQPKGMSYALQFTIKSETTWKIKDDVEKKLLKEQVEVLKSQYLKTGLPGKLKEKATNST